MSRFVAQCPDTLNLLIQDIHVSIHRVPIHRVRVINSRIGERERETEIFIIFSNGMKF